MRQGGESASSHMISHEFRYTEVYSKEKEEEKIADIQDMSSGECR